ncbi:MAG: formate dehydrogenase accessory sulfurtransferase FdhD [Candidatus Desulforudis sp.]|nr:formate dehydrogenase accessory sulfurtransferase FdhD [Desulforudis sp.]
MYRPVEALTALRNMHRYSNQEQTQGWDEIVTEAEYAIQLDDQEFGRLLCLPSHLEWLAAGHLALAGRLTHPGEIADMAVDVPGNTVRVRTRSAGDARPPAPAAGELRMTPEEIRGLSGQLPVISALFRRTGGVHTGGLAGKDSLLFIIEDTGRHNVLDKIYGRCFLEGIPLGDKALLFSGRSTGKIVMKLERMGIPMIIARGAPTTLAVDLAERAGITLIAFARPDRMSVFTHHRRVTGGLY